MCRTQHTAVAMKGRLLGHIASSLVFYLYLAWHVVMIKMNSFRHHGTAYCLEKNLYHSHDGSD